jgi:hypothetical protein
MSGSTPPATSNRACARVRPRRQTRRLSDEAASPRRGVTTSGRRSVSSRVSLDAGPTPWAPLTWGWRPTKKIQTHVHAAKCRQAAPLTSGERSATRQPLQHRYADADQDAKACRPVLDIASGDLAGREAAKRCSASMAGLRELYLHIGKAKRFKFRPLFVGECHHRQSVARPVPRQRRSARWASV